MQLTRVQQLEGMNGKQLRNSILQWAISGRLVPQDPNDEPAIELLKRINPKAAPLSPDDAPFTIPDSWCWCKVGDIVQINPKNDCPDGTMAAFIPMEKIEATYGSKYTYDEVKWCSIKKGYTHFADGDVAFAKITPCFQNRKSAVFKDLPNGIGAGTTELKVLRPYGETLNRWYLLYFLKSSYFIAEAKFKGTANQQRVVKGYLENKMFPLPPLAEQERIVRKVEELLPLVERYDKAQTDLDRLNASLKGKLRASVLQEAIAGRLVPQDPNDEPAIELLRRINPKAVPPKEEDIPFDIPDSWVWVRHNDIFDVSGGSQPPKSNFIDTPKDGYVRLYQIRDYGEKPVPVYVPQNMVSKFTKKGDILLARYGASLGKVFWAEEGAYNVAMAKVIPLYKPELINKQYIYLFYCSDIYQSCVRNHSRSAQAGFNRGDLNELSFPLPPLAEQERIVSKVEELFAVLDALQ